MFFFHNSNDGTLEKPGKKKEERFNERRPVKCLVILLFAYTHR